MSTEEKTITIPLSEYESLQKASAHLDILEARGVDNWSGYCGPTTYCRECDAEYAWFEVEKCTECGAEMPDPYDYY